MKQENRMRAVGGEGAIFYRVMEESSTAKVTFEQRPQKVCKGTMCLSAKVDGGEGWGRQGAGRRKGL